MQFEPSPHTIFIGIIIFGIVMFFLTREKLNTWLFKSSIDLKLFEIRLTGIFAVFLYIWWIVHILEKILNFIIKFI